MSRGRHAAKPRKQHDSHSINYDMQVFKAICIVMIAAGHLYGISNSGFEGPFALFPPYCFHVAAFAFISGYFYRAKSERHYLQFVKRKARTLLLPALVINVFYGLLCAVLHRYGFAIGDELSFETLVIRPFIDGHQFDLNYAMWFVPSLFFAEVQFALMRKLFFILPGKGRLKSVITDLFVTAASLTLAAFTIRSGLGPGLYLMVGRSWFLLGALAMGRIWRRYLEKITVGHELPLMCVVTCVQLVAFYYYGGEVAYTPSWLSFPLGPLPTFVVTMNGILFWLFFSKLLSPAIGTSRLVSLVANGTYSIMLHHRLVYFLISLAVGIISIHTAFFNGFDWQAMMNHGREWFGYFYLPGGYSQCALLYLMAGVLVPACIAALFKKRGSAKVDSKR